MKIILEALCYVLFMGTVAILATHPEARLLAADKGIISISVSHAGKRVSECRVLSQDELNALPPNMRTLEDCPRQRHPIRIELVANGKSIYSAAIAPSGLWSDGKSVAFDRTRLTAGAYVLQARLGDSGDPERFDYTAEQAVVLRPGQNLVIGFDERDQRFVFN